MAAPPPDFTTASATASATGLGQIASATASCPPGTDAIAGGFEAPSSSAVLGMVFESVKSGKRSWRASVQLLDLGTPSTLTLTTHVYCRKATLIKTVSATVPTDGRTQIGPSVTAACEGGNVALSAGYSIPAPLIGQVVTALILDLRRVSTSAWEARAATGNAAPSTFTLETYCAHPKNDPPLEATVSSEPNSTSFARSTATVACEGAGATFGGFAQPLSAVNSFLIVDESRLSEEGWRASAVHSGSNPPVTLSSTAYCDPSL